MYHIIKQHIGRDGKNILGNLYFKYDYKYSTFGEVFRQSK